jgi:hypothetical protein
VTKRVRYPQYCDNHPEVTTDLYYVYIGGKAGRLLCEKCKEAEYDAYRMDRSSRDGAGRKDD